MFGLVRPSLVGRVPGYPVFVDSPAVRRMPFKPGNGFLRGGPDPTASVRSFSADPIVSRRYLLQFSLYRRVEQIVVLRMRILEF